MITTTKIREPSFEEVAVNFLSKLNSEKSEKKKQEAIISKIFADSTKATNSSGSEMATESPKSSPLQNDAESLPSDEEPTFPPMEIALELMNAALKNELEIF